MAATDKTAALEKRIKALEELKTRVDKSNLLGEELVNTNKIQTLSRKVLQVPVIDDFTNALHDHNTNGKGGILGLAGTKIYYVANSGGGAVTRKLTFLNGILISET
jgi:hypothetical protein